MARDESGQPLRIPLAATFLVALAARLTHLHALAQTPFFTGLVVDAQAYERDAQTLLRHGAIAFGFYRPPLYSYIRAGLTLAGLGAPWALGAIHALVGSITASLLCFVAWRLVPIERARLRLWAAWAAGLSAALYGPLLIYDVEMLPTVWVNALLAVAYALATSQRTTLGAGDAIAGLCLGVATTGWAPTAVLVAALLPLRLQPVAPPQRARVAAAFLLAMGVAPGFTAIHNATHDAAGIIVSGNLGINLWLGNNPRWRETCKVRPGLYYDLEFQRATRAGATDLPSRESYYLASVADEFVRAPLDALLRTAEKFYVFMQGREIRRDQDLQWLREHSRIAAWLLWEHGLRFPFGWLLPLALACPARAYRARSAWILLAGAALYALTLALFALAARYRLPIVVVLIPLAGVNLAAWLEALLVERATRRMLDARGLALACVFVLCNLENRYTAGFAASTTERSLLLSQAYAAQGEREPALVHARTATTLSPRDPDAQVQLGRLLLNGGHAQDAALHFYRAGISLPESEVPWTLHGQAMFSLQRYADAIYNFREALARNPFHEESLRALSLTYLRVGDLAHATQALRRYLEAGYRDDAALRKLIKLLVDQHQSAQATDLLHALQARHPGWTTPNRLIMELAAGD